MRRYIESFTEGSNLYIAMEHADGGDLQTAIAAQKQRQRQFGGQQQFFPEPRVVRMFGEMLSALRHVHSKKILHRDLKAQVREGFVGTLRRFCFTFPFVLAS